VVRTVRSPWPNRSPPQLHVDVLFLDEAQHFLEAFLAPEPRLLDAASTASAVRCAVESSLVQIEQVRPYGTLSWRNARNNVTAMAAVDAKIGIGGKEDGIGEGFGHAHEAGIGETHGHV
jgi:hypothetical protein